MSHNDTLTRANTSMRATVDRIARVYRDGSEHLDSGIEWYPTANRVAVDIATRSGLSVPTVAGIIAALSPRTPWARNVDGARVCARGNLTGGFLSRSVDAANAIREGAPVESVLRGRKTYAFYRNILLDPDHVTIDVWAARVAGIDEKQLGRAGMYDAVSHAYRLAARRFGVLPYEAQAVTWCALRGTGE